MVQEMSKDMLALQNLRSTFVEICYQLVIYIRIFGGCLFNIARYDWDFFVQYSECDIPNLHNQNGFTGVKLKKEKVHVSEPC